MSAAKDLSSKCEADLRAVLGAEPGSTSKNRTDRSVTRGDDVDTQSAGPLAAEDGDRVVRKKKKKKRKSPE